MSSICRDVSGLLEQANGHFDVSGHPVNLRSGIIDLWAVNLIVIPGASSRLVEPVPGCSINQ
jgi:hypothetical protein